ncbi:GrpB family protein [Phenylobacterium sp.]|uniref:GrpB family protein n=1 Tax=Phenylobacterium sp. TaxID=1871053 RepID=UPI0030F3AF62
MKISVANARWPELFNVERASLRSLEPSPFLDIEHFGSTAVPGLAAKPVIDIMASVAGTDALDRAEPALAALGYHRLEVGFRKRRFYRKAEERSDEAVNLHVIPCERWANKNERLFRDWLIERPEVASAYRALKEELAARFPVDPTAYTTGKTEFIRQTVNQARRHLGLPAETNWDE